MTDIGDRNALSKQEDAAKDILAPVFANTNFSLLDMVKIQAQVLVPVLRAFRAELGEVRANQIASTALREWFQKLFHDVGARIPGSPRQKWEAIMAAVRPRIGNRDFMPCCLATASWVRQGLRTHAPPFVVPSWQTREFRSTEGDPRCNP